MKKNILLIAITAIIFSSIFSSCDKVLNIASMTATVNDTAWTSSVRVTVLDSSNFLITGTSLSGNVIAMTVFGATEGTYLLGIDSALSIGFEAVYTEGLSLNDVYTAASGEVKLTKIDADAETISGTFKFSAMNPELKTLEVKDGEFKDLKYTVPQ